jgi:hypothetical protein
VQDRLPSHAEEPAPDGLPLAEAGDALTLPGHVVAGFNLAQSIVYLGASRRLLEAALLRSQPVTAEDGIAFIGDSLTGLIALDQGLGAVRWVIANSPEAPAGFPAPGTDALDAFWVRVRLLRNELVHLDKHSLQNPLLMKIVADQVGLHVASGLAISFETWRGWLDMVQPWAAAALAQGIAPNTVPALPPSLLSMPKVRNPDPNDAIYPPPGVVWFGPRHNPAHEHVLDGRTSRFAPGEQVALTGHLVRLGASEITLAVTTPSNDTLVVQSCEVAPNADLASSTLTGLTVPGRYVVAFKDETDRILAIGSLDIALAQP